MEQHHSIGGTLNLDNSLLQNGTGRHSVLSSYPRSAKGNVGGLISSIDGQVTLGAKTVIQKGTAQDGGGIFLSGGSFEMNGSDINRNRAERGGGMCVYDKPIQFEINSGIIHHNSGKNGGGVLSFEQLTLNNCDIYENSSQGVGGGLIGLEVQLKSTNVEKNTTRLFGGGVQIADRTKLTKDNLSYVRNNSPDDINSNP